MKVVVIGLVFVLLSWTMSCGAVQRTITHWTGDLTYKCAKSGVEYVQSDSGLAVHVDPTGKPVSCKQ